MDSAILYKRRRALGRQARAMGWQGVLWGLMPALIAMAIGWAATAAGPGINADGVNYINMAANIQAGRGFVADFVDPYSELPYGPVTFWPPGFALLIAGAMSVGLSVIEAARWVSLLALGGIVCTTYLLGIWLGGRLCGVLSAITAASLMPVVRLGTFALSEAPFAFFSMLALLAAIHYVQSDTRQELRWILLCSLCIALAILTRYVGVFWLAGLGFIILWKGRTNMVGWLRIWLTILLTCALAMLPLIPWLLRNKQLTGYLSGMERAHKFHVGFVENLRFLIQTIASDLLPSIHLGLRGQLAHISPLALVVGGVCLLIVAIGCRGWIMRRGLMWSTSGWTAGVGWRWLGTPGALTFQFCALYLGGMLVLSSTMEFPPYDWPRTVAVIYPCLMTLAICVLMSGVRRLMNLRALTRLATCQPLVLVAIAALWIIPYALQTRGFVQEAAQGQEFTLPAWRNNQALGAMANLLEDDSVVYSDRAPVAYLYLQRPMRYLPYRTEIEGFRQLLETKRPHLSGAQYVLTFKGKLGSNDPYRSSRMSYAELVGLMAERTDITLLADLADGAIFRLNASSQPVHPVPSSP